MVDSLAKRLLAASAQQHKHHLSAGANFIKLPTGTITAGAEAGVIATEMGERSFSVRDSVDLALFAARMDEALCHAKGDFEQRDAERLMQALWAIEHLTAERSPPSTWRRMRTSAGMIAAAWEVGMVDPPLPVSDRVILKVATMLRIDRFRGKSDLYALSTKEGHISALAARREQGGLALWSGPQATSNFMDDIAKLIAQ